MNGEKLICPGTRAGRRMGCVTTALGFWVPSSLQLSSAGGSLQSSMTLSLSYGGQEFMKSMLGWFLDKGNGEP